MVLLKPCRAFLLSLVLMAVSASALPKGSSSSSEGSSKPSRWTLFPNFRKSKLDRLPSDPPIIEQARELMTEHQYLEIKPLWDHAVKQKWIHGHNGLPIQVDGKRRKAEAEAIDQLMSKLDPFIEELGKKMA
ncbi:hypothetical protein PSEUBRA_005409 [Kalmanozyma brasiliensis GHG001]|uniref:uncharacterized protein n=1 Tax=Kalmanozyma brasiliensis (strain GHG001) TaxID=1365824 RepID=UPI0028683290|nr:uncharacterized protein PSEUBRA_005409 [Kalmanozyma brasiliensis GHG001]KAF6767521.1 hypothetical protein PSEUBRA_005409 [Kalmanozyma brasiliensis GHG001]